MKSNNDSSIGRFRIIMAMIAIIAVYILGTALHTMLPPQSNYWEQVDKRFTTETYQPTGRCFPVLYPFIVCTWTSKFTIQTPQARRRLSNGETLLLQQASTASL